MLYLAGRYSYRHFSTTRAKRAMARLEELDASMAERLVEDWAAWRESVRQSGATPPQQNRE
jgi:hypothetical protein